MKKIIILSFIVSVFSLSSCQKDYTCTCTLSDNGTSVSTSSTINDTYGKAREKCKDKNFSFGGAENNCSLK